MNIDYITAVEMNIEYIHSRCCRNETFVNILGFFYCYVVIYIHLYGKDL